MSETVLFIDSAYDACSVGLLKADGTFTHVFEPMKYGHAEALMPLINGIMKNNSVTAEKLDGIVVNIGPGRFTGIRLAIAAAKSLALPFGTKLYGITGSEVYAFKAQEAGKNTVITMIDSGRGNYFCQVFGNDGISLTEIEDLSPEEAENLYAKFSESGGCITVGDTQSDILGNLEVSLLNAEDMYLYRKEAVAEGRKFHPVTPLYVRPPDVCLLQK